MADADRTSGDTWDPEHAKEALDHYGSVDAAVAGLRQTALLVEMRWPDPVYRPRRAARFLADVERRERLLRDVAAAWEEA